MVELNIRQIAESKGITKPADLARRCGLHRNIAGELLRHGHAPFTRSTIERLCAGLQVTPAELFVTEPVTDELPEEAQKDHQTPKQAPEVEEAAAKQEFPIPHSKSQVRRFAEQGAPLLKPGEKEK